MTHVKKSQQSYIDVSNKQAEKGLEKYGQALDPLDNYDWLRMAEEEIIDNHQYLIAERKKRAFIVDKIRNLTIESDKRDEIYYWLDRLIGK